MENHLQRISELKQQLMDIGYHSAQVHNIVKEIADRGNLANITSEQGEELVEVLEYYYNFAQKCRDGI